MTNTTNSNTTSTSSSTKKLLIALGLGLATVATTLAVVQATNDSSADESAAVVIESTPAPEPSPAVTDAPAAPEVPAVEPKPATPEPAITEVAEAPVTEAPKPKAPVIPVEVVPVEVVPADVIPADAATGPETDLQPILVVIGQDENGEDIVVEIEISEACGTTFHHPLDEDSPSFIRWEFKAPGLAPGTTVEVTGKDGFSQFTTVLDDQTIVIEQGISSYGTHPFPEVEWDTGDDTSSSVSVNGSHTVDDEEGEASRTCSGVS